MFHQTMTNAWSGQGNRILAERTFAVLLIAWCPHNTSRSDFIEQAVRSFPVQRRRVRAKCP
ncbi:hypothetical protein [Candidatus Amarolinea dominans]|uniref:hypothetical protein n=1 Tax=Candidatus Amarolinea dominans TaxID=3140696 RepID=UPI001D3CB2C5|nr:hypothetical protein [Anaerolineae bacterium]